MVSVLALRGVDGGFKHQLGQTKHFKIGICYLFAAREAFTSKSKDGLAWNQDNVLGVEPHIYLMTVVSRDIESVYHHLMEIQPVLKDFP